MSKHVRRSIQLGVALMLLLVGGTAWSQADTSISEVRALRSEARRAYARAFVDRELWTETLEQAELLVEENPGDLEARRLLAEIYSETRWWIRAWEAWNTYNDMGGRWDSETQQEAVEAALSLAFYAQQRDDEEALARWMGEAAAVRLN